MLNNERVLGYYFVKLVTRGGTSYSYDIENVISKITELVDKKQLYKNYNSGSYAIKGKEAVCDDKSNIMQLLINKTDTREVDPTFEKIEMDDLRIERKNVGEGICNSLHLAFDLQKFKGTDYHLCIIEHNHVLGKAKIAAFINQLLKSNLSYKTKELVDGRDKTVTYYPELVFEVVQDNFKRDIENGGRIKEVIVETFIKKGDRFDDEPWIDTIVEKKVIKVVSDDDIVDGIKHWYKKYKEELVGSIVKIHYETSCEKSKTSEVHIKNDALEIAFGKIVRIDLDDEIDASGLESMHKELISKMCELVTNER